MATGEDNEYKHMIDPEKFTESQIRDELKNIKATKMSDARKVAAMRGKIRDIEDNMEKIALYAMVLNLGSTKEGVDMFVISQRDTCLLNLRRANVLDGKLEGIDEYMRLSNFQSLQQILTSILAVDVLVKTGLFVGTLKIGAKIVNAMIGVLYIMPRQEHKLFENSIANAVTSLSALSILNPPVRLVPFDLLPDGEKEILTKIDFSQTAADYVRSTFVDFGKLQNEVARLKYEEMRAKNDNKHILDKVVADVHEKYKPNSEGVFTKSKPKPSLERQDEEEKEMEENEVVTTLDKDHKNEEVDEKESKNEIEKKQFEEKEQFTKGGHMKKTDEKEEVTSNEKEKVRAVIPKGKGKSMAMIIKQTAEAQPDDTLMSALIKGDINEQQMKWLKERSSIIKPDIIGLPQPNTVELVRVKLNEIDEYLGEYTPSKFKNFMQLYSSLKERQGIKEDEKAIDKVLDEGIMKWKKGTKSKFERAEEEVVETSKKKKPVKKEKKNTQKADKKKDEETEEEADKPEDDDKTKDKKGSKTNSKGKKSKPATKK